MDLGYTGPRFTWFKGGSGVKERLDRGLCNLAWHHKFPQTHVSHLIKMRSDHRPILICNKTIPTKSKLVRRFQFLAPWLSHDEFLPFLSSSWIRGQALPCALQDLSSKLQVWNKEVFGNIFQKKKRLANKLHSLETLNERNPSTSSLEEEKKVREDLEDVLWQEEILWLQKSRANWTIHGDQNSRFFHSSTLSRRKRNKIISLRNEAGEWITDPDLLQDMAREHYVKLFTKCKLCNRSGHHSITATFPPITSSRWEQMERSPTFEEIHGIIKEMNGLKAPGKDGFHALFFQRCWKLVGQDFFKSIQECFRNPESIRTHNETLLALIPKVDSPSSMSQFRPISLCNVGYKVVAKCIANKLKCLMPHLVKPNQSSFVPNRHITDNILILQETVHSMARKKGKKGMMLLKLDLAKVYDRLDWDFFEEPITLAGLPQSIIRVIMKCVTTVEMQVLWEGGETQSFKPSRGLRQGCPLSPYLFTLCVERLGHCISEEVSLNRWNPVKLSAGGPPLIPLVLCR
ncbi:unnamed protein product [Linum trigynum]|uniref:Reverse transcriptase domain-containing protein n=1 Tax=Linum trigynum TaxID=586398 RepID=A0AAV2CJ80_9ROSI